MPRSTRAPTCWSQTIQQVLGIPINHYMSVDFPGFSGMVNALGGITMDFPTGVKDAYTGLDVTTTGCQIVNGTVALQLVRSRHLFYMNSNGYWEGDGLSDFSRIQRQDAFFRAVLAKLRQSSLDPFTINSFIGAAVGNLTIDDTLSKGDLLHIAQDFRSLPSSHLITETLPTIGLVTGGGADVLKEAQPYAQNMISAFNRIGITPAPTTSPQRAGATASPTTVPPTEAHSQVDVNVLNAAAVSGIAHTTATALSAQGFHVGQIGDATSPLAPGSPSEILYGPSGKEAALDVGLHAQRAGDHGDRPGTGRPDGLAVDRRLPAGGDRIAGGRCHDHHHVTWTDHDDHDDDPLGRLREHAARALEPVPVHPRPGDPGLAPDDDDPPEEGVVPTRSAQADLRRWRTIRRRSRSVVPPQIPSRSRWARACSRHAWRTGQTAQTALASAASASSSVTG